MTDVQAQLAELRGTYASRRPNARTIASLRENPGCAARRVFDAAGVDKADLASDLGHPAQSGQSPFAIARGDRFEADVKADGYAMAIALLHEHGYPTDPIRILPLRDRHPINPKGDVDATLKRRAAETRDALTAMARGDKGAYNLIDGGALEWDLGGAVARLEADGIAWRFDGHIHVAEIKSFPLVDGRADPEKAGAAAWQGAVYLAAIAELFVSAGLPLSHVSTQLLLICPRNTSLQPTLTPVDVSRHLRSLRRLIESRASVAELIEPLPKGASLDISGMSADAAKTHLSDVISGIGTRYVPACLSSCELAGFCRQESHSRGGPERLGTDAAAGLAGVESLARAAELAAGAKPRKHETESADALQYVAALIDQASAP